MEVTKVEPVAPPLPWMTCPKLPEIQGRSNEDLLRYALDLRSALEECRGRMLVIRKWRDVIIDPESSE